MLSRVADSIYWLNRYVERAENVARFIDVNLNLMLDCPIGLAEQWKPLVLTTGDLPLFEERYGQATAGFSFSASTATIPTLYLCLRAARENARSVREIISREVWEQVTSI